MAKEDKLPFRLSFRCDDETLEGLEELSEKLRTGQSEVLRIAVKQLMETSLHKKTDILVIDREKFDKIANTFSEQVLKNSRELLDRQQSRTIQVINKLLEQPGMKEALKSVKREDIEIKEKE